MSERKCINILKLVGDKPGQLSDVKHYLSETIQEVNMETGLLLFETAWVAPNKTIKQISTFFPNVIFLLEGRVEDEFVTRTVHNTGKLVDLEELKMDEEHKSILFSKYELTPEVA